MHVSVFVYVVGFKIIFEKHSHIATEMNVIFLGRKPEHVYSLIYGAISIYFLGKYTFYIYLN